MKTAISLLFLAMLAIPAIADDAPLLERSELVDRKQQYSDMVTIDEKGDYPFTLSLAQVRERLRPHLRVRVFLVAENGEREEIKKYRITIDGTKKKTTSKMKLDAGRYEFKTEIAGGEFMIKLEKD